MKKCLIIALATICFLSLQADEGHAPLLDYDKKLQNFERTHKELAPYADKIGYTAHTVYYGSGGAHTTYTYYAKDYSLWNVAWRAALDAYQASYNSLLFANCNKALGDGFMVGAATATATRLLTKKYFSAPIATAGAVASMAMIVYQNKKQADLPYLDHDILVPQNNFFANVSLQTTARMFCSLFGSAFGYAGTTYAAAAIAPGI